MSLLLPKKSMLLCAAFLCGLHASAADLYMLPQGAGEQSGTDWANALSYAADADSLQNAWNQLTPGDTLYLGGGEYEARSVTLSADGSTKADTKTLKGVTRDGQRPVFTGTWEKEDKGSGFAMFKIAPKSSWWAIENIEIRKCREGVVTSSPGQVSNGRIIDVDVQETRDAFVFIGGAYSSKPEVGSHNIEIRDCDVLYYTKRGFRFRDGCYDIVVANCTADAGGREWYIEPFPMSFNVIGGKRGSGVFDHDITFIDCVAKNNWHVTKDSSYWNGDGFCAEGTAYNLTYIRCESYGNTDGGWDDKSANPLLISCIAKDNKKNYRFWGYEPGAVLYNCISDAPIKRGGNSNYVGMWTGGKVQVIHSSFINSKIPMEVNTYRVTPEKKARMLITVKDSIVELPEGTNALPTENFVVSNNFIRPLGSDAKPEANVPGYTEFGKGVDLLARARPLQPLLKTEAKLLEAKRLSIYGDKNPSGWYLSGWNGAEMRQVRGEGIDYSNALAVTTKGSSGGGATYRTKRLSATVQFVNYAPANWELRMSIRTKPLPLKNLEINILAMSKEVKFKELPLPGVLDGSVTDWQEIAIPLKDFVTNDKDLVDFAGFYIRTNGDLPTPLYIDNVRLEPAE